MPFPTRIKVGDHWVPVRFVAKLPPEEERIRKSALKASNEAQANLRALGIPYAIGRHGKIYMVQPDGTEVFAGNYTES